MGKYTRYSSGYPTIYRNWMYPPKNMGMMRYIGLNLSGLWKAHASNIKTNWTYFLVTGVVLYGVAKISKASKGSKFCQSHRDPEGNWLYGPPTQKLLDELQEHEIIHAPHK